MVPRLVWGLSTAGLCCHTNPLGHGLWLCFFKVFSVWSQGAKTCTPSVLLSMTKSPKLGGLNPQKHILLPKVYNQGENRAGPFQRDLAGALLHASLGASGGRQQFLAFLGLQMQHSNLRLPFT